MKPLYKPKDDFDLSIVESLLEANGINYYVFNRHFSSLYPGVQIGFFNATTIMVPEEEFERARDVLIENYEVEEEQPKQNSFFDNLRIALEALFSGWFNPGKRLSKRKPDVNENRKD